MILILHIVIALTSILFSTYCIVSPSKKKINGNYLFLAGTWISGFFLVFQNHVSFGHLCLSGILYTGIVTVNMFLAKRKLALEKTRE